MDRKTGDITGIRVELTPGTDEAFAVDEFVDDLIHGDTDGALRTLHEPHPGAAAEAEPGRAVG